MFVVSTFTAAEILFSKLLILLQLIQFADYKTITKHTFSYIKSNRNYTYLNQQQLHEDSMYYLLSVLVITAHGLFNPLMGTLKLQNNGPLYSNIVSDWYTGWADTFHAALSSPLLTVPNATAHPSTANLTTSYY